jgi:pimeloyl-ACP methyl ester carboxylesterase
VTTSTSTDARLHDGTTILVRRQGGGPAVLLPVRTDPLEPETAATVRQWGGDPDQGATLVAGLADAFTVVTADYEGHRLAHPAPETLTPSAVTQDLLAVADAAGVDRFAYVGYSWLGLSGLQLAQRTDRLTALVVGGFPPVEGPYAAMLAVTRAAHQHALRSGPAAVPEATPGDWDADPGPTDPAVPRQFVTLYEGLQGVDDAVALGMTVPRLVFAGAEDLIVYGPQWGDVRVAIGETLARTADVLQAAGWQVRVLPGLDHLGALHGDVVLEVVRPFLIEAGLASAG